MMGIRLDWEIEAENEWLESGGEDPESRRQRWEARLRLFGLLALFVLLVTVLIGGLVLRMRQVDWEIEQRLRDTVETEVAALRVGDRRTFVELQRSATDEWQTRQGGVFDDYQTLKTEADAQLTGRIVNAMVDRQRARVQVEEIIDGQAYVQTWFYWRYEDGWRHVPPDYTFWGDSAVLQNDYVTVHFRGIDQAYAQLLYDELTAWLVSGCAALACASTPALTVDIVANPLTQLGWLDTWALQLPSPYIGRAPLNVELEPSTRFQLAVMVARRLVEGVSAQPLAGEAAFLRESIISWLVERFARAQMNAHLIYSLAARYGDVTVGQVLGALTPDATVALLSSITGVSLELTGLDWRDYIEWRLSQAQPGQEYEVTGAVVEYADGMAQLRAQVRMGTTQTEVLYRLIDGVWQRAG